MRKMLLVSCRLASEYGDEPFALLCGRVKIENLPVAEENSAHFVILNRTFSQRGTIREMNRCIRCNKKREKEMSQYTC